MGRIRSIVVGATIALVVCVAPGVSAQAPESSAGQSRAADVGPGEIQRLFDAYTVMQAQEALQLDDQQFGRFLPQLRAVQRTRRRAEVDRARLTVELGRLLDATPPVDEARIQEHLKRLTEHDLQADAAVRAAYAALNQTLDVRRQARFRVFEQQMERRKLDLVIRSRRTETRRPARQDR